MSVEPLLRCSIEDLMVSERVYGACNGAFAAYLTLKVDSC